MSENETETETQDAGGTLWDAPNQQVVRDDASPPWQEGTGGETGEPVEDELTKEELLAEARNLGVSPANNAMTKEELREAIERKRAEGQ